MLMFLLIPPALIILPAAKREWKLMIDERKKLTNLSRLFRESSRVVNESLYDEEILYGPQKLFPCPSGGCTVPLLQWDESLRCQSCFNFIPRSNSKTLKNFQPGLHNEFELPDENELTWPEYVWANGYRLSPLDPNDTKFFLTIKGRAYLENQYNDIPLDEGGLDALYIDWFRMKGAADSIAALLVENGEKPWLYEDLRW